MEQFDKATLVSDFISDHMDDILERMVVGLVRDYHNIQDSDIVRKVGETFGADIRAKVSQASSLHDYLLEETSEATSEQDALNHMETALDEDLDTGDVVFDLVHEIVDDDTIHDILVNDIAEQVSTYPDFDMTAFTAFAKEQPLADLVINVNSTDYDELYSDYQDKQKDR